MNLCDSQQLLWRLITAPEGVAKALADEPRDAALLADTVAGGPERSAQIEGWNATARPYPRESSISELFEAQVERTPEAMAVRFGADEVTRHLDHRPPALGRTTIEQVGIDILEALEELTALLFESLQPAQWRHAHLVGTRRSSPLTSGGRS